LPLISSDLDNKNEEENDDHDNNNEFPDSQITMNQFDLSLFDNMEVHITKEQFNHITNNCYDLYNKYIKFDKYKLSTNLMDEIFNKIENCYTL
jgi:hypothetical protein